MVFLTLRRLNAVDRSRRAELFVLTDDAGGGIESSQGQEDHVSMGANAATKALRVAENLERVLAIELFNATQALEFRRPLKSSPIIEKFVAEYRKQVEFVRIDKVMYTEIAKSVQFVKDYPLDFDILKNE